MIDRAKFKLYRDETTSNYPSPDQIDIGELVMNSVTGKLFTKIVGGHIIEFIGQRICFESQNVPEIIFDSVAGFCCTGDIVTATVKGLLPDQNYTFELIELTNNNATINLRQTVTNFYTLQTADGSVQLKEAVIPADIVINSNNPITILKLRVLRDNALLTEKILPVSCSNCTPTS